MKSAATKFRVCVIFTMLIFHKLVAENVFNADNVNKIERSLQSGIAFSSTLHTVAENNLSLPKIFSLQQILSCEHRYFLMSGCSSHNYITRFKIITLSNTTQASSNTHIIILIQHAHKIRVSCTILSYGEQMKSPRKMHLQFCGVLCEA